MKDIFTNYIEKLKEIYGRLEVRQKIVLSALLIVTIAAFVWLISWSSREEYGLLFGKMDPTEAAKVIEKLDEMKEKYKLANNGTSILISAEKVYETRIKLSTDGIGIKQGTGFEIFDKTTLGMTEKVQSINFQRAMEGELQRTIETITNIDYVRIHLVFPEDKLFKEDQQEPSAAVLVKLRQKLKPRQIEGISNLIASAVEGLEPSNVNIVDQDGNVLSEHEDTSSTGLSNTQIKMQRELENSLAKKAQSMLNSILGNGNSVVRISAELNFDSMETTLDKFDPENRVVRSEEIESSSSDNLVDSINTSTEHLITNYEINHTIQHIKSQIGDIKRLTVSVNVNYKLNVTEEDGETIKEYIERTPEEILQIQNLVSNAVGLTADRGDQIVVTSMRVDDSEIELYKQQQADEIKRKQLVDMVEKGAVLLVLLVLMFTLTSQFKKIFAKPEEEPEPELIRPILAEGEAEEEGFYEEGEEGMPMGEGKITYAFKPMKDIEIEQTESLILREAVQKFILENPETASKLLKSWMLDRKN